MDADSFSVFRQRVCKQSATLLAASIVVSEVAAELLVMICLTRLSKRRLNWRPTAGRTESWVTKAMAFTKLKKRTSLMGSAGFEPATSAV
jgi:hypothetical protein